MQSFKVIFLGVMILQEVEFPIFLLIFALALKHCCSATALPVSSVPTLKMVVIMHEWVIILNNVKQISLYLLSKCHG